MVGEEDDSSIWACERVDNSVEGGLKVLDSGYWGMAGERYMCELPASLPRLLSTNCCLCACDEGIDGLKASSEAYLCD